MIQKSSSISYGNLFYTTACNKMKFRINLNCHYEFATIAVSADASYALDWYQTAQNATSTRTPKKHPVDKPI